MFQASSGGLASQLFSTAVISGSKSLPNLVADCKNSKYFPSSGIMAGVGPGVNTVLGGQTLVTTAHCCLAELLVPRCKYRQGRPGCYGVLPPRVFPPPPPPTTPSALPSRLVH